jgi:hypothetical protein
LFENGSGANANFTLPCVKTCGQQGPGGGAPGLASTRPFKALQHAFQIIEGAPKARLPILATANDVREVVPLLKKRPEGITVVEASEATRRRLFDPRRITAYELWGIASKSGDRIMLSELGREFAGRFESEARLYRVLLDNTPPYRALLEWIYRQQLDLVTYADIEGTGKITSPALSRAARAPRPGETRGGGRRQRSAVERRGRGGDVEPRPRIRPAVVPPGRHRNRGSVRVGGRRSPGAAVAPGPGVRKAPV